MDRYDEMFDVIKKGLALQQLTARNEKWAYADDKDKANIIDKQISDILNPKQGVSLLEKTHDAFETDEIGDDDGNV